MVSTTQSPTNTRSARYFDAAPKPPRVDFRTSHLMHSPDSSILAPRTSLGDISNAAHHLSTTVPVATPTDYSSSLLSHFYPAIHVDRVATGDRHDTDAWPRDPKTHDTKLLVAVASPTFGSNCTTPAPPDNHSAAGVAGSGFTLMDFRTQGLWTVEQSSNAVMASAVWPHDRTPLVAPASDVSTVQPDGPIGSCSYKDLSEGRRRVGEILVRCGVIDVSGVTPIESTDTGCGNTSTTLSVNSPGIATATTGPPFHETHKISIIALSDWTSEWMYTLVVQPYLRGGFPFQYCEKPSKGSLVSSRIRRVLSAVNNPVQVAIHALWFIGILTGNGGHDNAPFLSVPIFRYLHNNGTFVVEDFLFRTFVACAMIGDKTVNDATLSTATWNRLTRIPQAILNATERYTLGGLDWNVVMTQAQWQDTIVYLRSCIKMGSVFDPFAYDENSPSGVMARCLDELISLSYSDEPSPSQQGPMPTMETEIPRSIRHSIHWEVLDGSEWCPEEDPVINKQPRSIGIAPGPGSGPLGVGTTAKDLLESILGSRNVSNFTHLGRPAGTSFCGSFGAIGARLAHTVKIASACQNASWVHSHNYIST